MAQSNGELRQRIFEEIESCSEMVYPQHEYGDMWKDRNREHVEQATATILALVEQEIAEAVKTALEQTRLKDKS